MNRDQQVYRQFYLDWHTPLIAFSTSITGSYEASEELYSDLMMKIWNMGEDLLKVNHLKVYLYRAIKNASLNELAKRQRASFVDIDSIPLHSPVHGTPESDLLYREMNVRLSRAIAALPPKGRLVFTLIKEEGLSYKEVSEVLGISVNTIEGHMTTTLKKLSVDFKRYK